METQLDSAVMRFDTVVEICAYIMLLMGLMISITRNIQRMTRYYQYTCASLAAITLLTALELQENLRFVSGAFVIIPILLGFFVKPLLAQATVMGNAPVLERLMRWFRWAEGRKTNQQALPDWLHTRRVRPGIMTLLAVDLFVVVLAFVTAYSFAGSGMSQITSLVLAVSFSLLLLGLTTMVNAADTISQVSGLLVMEQGMFLAAIRCIPDHQMRIVFVLGLFLYTIITLTILVVLLPELHLKSGSLDVDQQTLLKG